MGAKRAGAAGVVIGAALATAVLVTVHEGTVALASESGQVALQAGEAARMAPGAAPTRVHAPAEVELRRAQDQLRAVEGALRAARADGAAAQVVEENARLAAEVAALQERLAVAEQQKKELGGDAIPFPDDLPPRFAQEALLDAFQQAIEETGSRSEITSIDCTEYPCIVYGWSETDEDFDGKLERGSALQPYGEDSKHVRGWSTSKDGRYQWGVALAPKVDKGPDAPVDDAAHARLQHRFRMMVNATKAR